MPILIANALFLIVLCIAIHAVGTTTWLRYLSARYADSSGVFLPGKRLAVLIGTALVLISLHIIEILVWAAAFLVVAPGELESLEAAFYFSAVTFTTLGYGDVTLSSEWRLLSGFEAIGGILLMGWTTAFMFAVLQRTWGNMARRNA